MNTPWRSQGRAKIFGLNYHGSRDYVKLNIFDTKDAKEVPALLHKAFMRIIELTENELAAKTEDK